MKKLRRQWDPWAEIPGTLSAKEADEMLAAIHAKPAEQGARLRSFTRREATAGDARAAGYIASHDPNDPAHVLLYDKNDPDRRAAKSTAQKLANAARVV